MKGGASLKLTMERPPKRLIAGFQDLPTTALAELLTLDSVMRHVIRPLWTPMPRIAGPAYTVRTVKHDNLMLHAAIYHAEPGDVIVVQAGDDRMAGAGGNVCAVAPRHGGPGCGREPARVGAQAPRAGGELPARARLSRLEPDPAGHQAGHEDHHHHERQLDVIEGVEARRDRRVHREAPAQPDPPADEGDHGPDLEEEDEEKEAHLGPEERRREIELGAL